MEKILVPTDLSDIAELGLELAVEIAKRSHATISLVNFTKHPFGKTFSAMGDVNTKTDEEANLYTIQLLHTNKAKLESLASHYTQQGVAIEYAIVDEELRDGIDSYLNREYIDLVVMGTSGEETATESFTGNNTEQVIKISSCPVLSVRDGFNVSDFKNIVLAVNVIKDDQITYGLAALRDLADCFESHVHLVHVKDKESDSIEDLKHYFTKMAELAGLITYSVTILEADDAAEAVISFARQINAGMVSVIKNSTEGIFRIFSNHFSNRLVKEVGRPVFTFNLQNAFVNMKVDD